MKKAQQFSDKIKRKYIRKTIDVECVCSAFETKYNPDFYFSGEFHPFWEFVYVLSGSVGVSGDERIYRLNEGDIIFHKPMEFHRLWAVNDEPIRLFIMSFFIEGPLCKRLENSVLTLDSLQKQKINELIEYLRKNSKFETSNKQVTHFLNNWDDASVSQNTGNRMESFFLSLERRNSSMVKSEYSHEEIKVYKQIISYLTENVNEWITLDDIACECSMSKSTLKRIFAKISPDGVHKYFVKLKIAEAMKLLLSGLSVVETADALGFSSPNYFCTVFKRETGMTPVNYRKKEF